MTAAVETPASSPDSSATEIETEGPVVEIKATIQALQGGKSRSYVLLEPDMALLEHPAKAVWRFFDTPTDYEPSIVIVRFSTTVGADGKLQVHLRPFKDLILNRDQNTITGEPYPSTAGTYWYEVVLVGTGGDRRRLYCMTSEMGGVEVEQPPSGGG